MKKVILLTSLAGFDEKGRFSYENGEAAFLCDKLAQRLVDTGQATLIDDIITSDNEDYQKCEDVPEKVVKPKKKTTKSKEVI